LNSPTSNAGGAPLTVRAFRYWGSAYPRAALGVIVALCGLATLVGFVYLVAAVHEPTELRLPDVLAVAAGFCIAAVGFVAYASDLVRPIERALAGGAEPGDRAITAVAWRGAQQLGDRLVFAIFVAGVTASGVTVAVGVGSVPADVLQAGVVASALALCAEIVLVLPVGRALMVPVLDELKRRDPTLVLDASGGLVAHVRRVIVPGLFALNCMGVVLTATLTDPAAPVAASFRYGALGLGLVVMVGITWYYLALLLGPLDSLIAGLSSVTDVEQGWRAGIVGVGELGALGEQIDAMLERLRESERVSTLNRQLLERNQRMETMGVLAASVAHDVNNPAAALQNNLQVLRDALEAAGTPDAIELIEESLEAVARIQSIVSDLLGHARQETQAVSERIALSELLSSSVRMGRRELSGVRVELEPCQQIDVHLPKERVRQVFVNLFVNAAHALADSPNPTLRVAVRRTACCALVAVSNNGPMIPEPIAAHIFEPFFTTKPAGIGTGLGLYICRSIVTEIGGDLRVSSNAEWTTFEVKLPLTEG